jgi:hypothetical protein
MSVNAPKPIEMLPIDYADHTLEVDIRWLLAEKQELSKQADAIDADDPRAATDLTAEQVQELLNLRK